MSKQAWSLKPTGKHVCDCGEPGTRKDGSGWFCEECAAMITRAAQVANRMIIEQRTPDAEHCDVGSGRTQLRSW